MLNKRCAQILKLIFQNPNITITELLSELNVSERTIYYDLNNIDDFLLENNLPALEKSKTKGVTLKLTEGEYSLLFSKINNASYEYVLSQEERVIIIINELIKAGEYIIIDELSRRVNVSRSTLLKDIKVVKSYLEDKKCKIISKPRYGIKIGGNEADIRGLIIDHIFQRYSNNDLLKIVEDSKDNYGKTKFIIDEFTNFDEFLYIKKCVMSAENELQTFFSDNVFFFILIQISTMINRIRGAREVLIPNKEIEVLKNTQEFAVSYNIAKMIEDYFNIRIPINEIAYMARHFLEVSNVEANRIKDPSLYIYQVFVSNIIDKMSQKVKINLLDDEILWNGLISHIKPMFYRLKHNQSLKNPLINEIKTTYKTNFDNTKEALEGIEIYFDKKLSDDEVAYFTLHFEAAIERNRRNTENKKNVIVVCNAGIGTARILEKKLLDMFDINIIGCIAYRSIEEVINSKKPDLIISTMPINITNNIPVVKVNPLLKEYDLFKLNKHISYRTDEEFYLKEKFNKIVELVDEKCIVKDREGLLVGLEKIVFQDRDVNQKGELMLKDVLNEKTIKLNVEAKNWEEAVRIGGNLLVQEGIAKAEYVDAMIKSVKDIGPYIVLAPGFAMPHARPEAGAIKPGFSMITLSNPVEFGNEENDPVTLVVCLCSPDNNSHMKALSELVSFLDNDENMDLIKNAKDPKEITSKFKQHSFE